MSSRITHNPEQCGGKPCIRGMRIRVRDILELYAAGESSAQILADFPDLEVEDLKAALAYAAREIDHPVLGDFQESCHSLAATQAALIKGSARSGSGSSVGLFIHTSAG